MAVGQHMWQVTTVREWCGQTIRHHRWFTEEDGVREYLKWINDGRGKLLRVDKYLHIASEKFDDPT